MEDFMYSRKKVDKAGIALLDENITEEDKKRALEILSAWRSLHSYPMNVFKNRLEKCSKRIDNKSYTSQRLKRASSIIGKLRRLTTRLTQIQDIAGCRTILTSMERVRKLEEECYLKGDIKHKLISRDDYISHPKEDGYRSLHLIYRYKSDKPGKQRYNNTIIEVQIRTRLQHIWATAVETSSFFTGQMLKVGEGDNKWIEFFKYVSSAFAMIERTAPVPKTPLDKNRLHLKIKELEKELKVLEKLSIWTNSIRHIDVIRKRTKAEFFLLKLDTNIKELSITAYTKREISKAIEDYSDYEKDIYQKKGYDVVLVGSDDIDDLKKTYPNYFMDTNKFRKYLLRIIEK